MHSVLLSQGMFSVSCGNIAHFLCFFYPLFHTATLIIGGLDKAKESDRQV